LKVSDDTKMMIEDEKLDVNVVQIIRKNRGVLARDEANKTKLNNILLKRK